jgi:putative transposase
VSAAIQASSQLEALPACLAIGVARATFYRYRNNVDGSQNPPLDRQPPARSLSSVERKTVLDLLTSERFADDAPRQIWAALLDEGKYFCSVSTMYRILRADCGVRERRDQLRHPVYSKPELLATSPN